jgi:hypothetical protein
MLGAMFINHHATGSVIIKSLFQKKARKEGKSAGACTLINICCVSINYASPQPLKTSALCRNKMTTVYIRITTKMRNVH